MKQNLNLLVAVILVVSSCKKEESANSKKETNYNFNATELSIPLGYDGFFHLLEQHSYIQSSPSSAPSNFSFHGNFCDPEVGSLNCTMLDAGNIELNGINISKRLDHVYEKSSFSSGSFYGITDTFKISGNSGNNIDPGQVDFYVPAKIYMSGLSGKTISKSANNVITWNVDNGYSGDVYIKISYRGAMSNDQDSSLSSSDIHFNDNVSDNAGSYTIPSGAFTGMPTGGILDITIGRGNFGIVNCGAKEAIILITTITNATFNILD